MKKNSTFTILVFIVIIGILALCVYVVLAGLGVIKSDDKEPAATVAPTVSSSAVKEAGSDDSTTDSAKKDDADNTESKTETGKDSQKDDSNSKSVNPKPKQRAGSDTTPAPANKNSGSLSEQEATGEDNVISFDDLQ